MSVLPRIAHPTLEATLPITGTKIKYRPYTLKEEKILMLGMRSGENGDEKAALSAVKQVITSCVVEPAKFDAGQIHIFDMEYMLVKLRIASVGESIDLTFKDKEDGGTYNIVLNLNKVLDEIIANTKNLDSTVRVDEDIVVVMRPLTVDMLIEGDLIEVNDDNAHDALPLLVSQIATSTDAWNVADVDPDEVAAFFESFTSEAAAKLVEYLDNIPTMKYVVKYTNKNSTEVEYPISSILDFFQ